MLDGLTYWHPIFVHFTVALWSVSFLFFFLSLFTSEDSKFKHQWLTVGRWNLWLGMVFTTLTIFAGWVASNTVNHDTPSHAMMMEHRFWALTTVTVFVLLTVWSIWLFVKQREEPKVFVLTMFLAVGLLGTTGWYGGELVYRHGLGVMSLPSMDDHDHGAHGDGGDHNHGENAESGHHAHGDADSGSHGHENSIDSNH
ncbi:MAG: DUF2231 domain-containing protein, partial [Gammaproteobacteria bacterium]|nr:DUF2231 domain-containing protein [Gammaproteobacteria bacterium]